MLAASKDVSGDRNAPVAPEGVENSWLETVPGKSWFIVFRRYGPLEPWFDQTWRPGEIELVE